MKWFFAGTMAYWFLGQKRNFFQDEGLEPLQLLPGGPESSAVTSVAARADRFGVVGSEELLIARLRNIPVVAIGVIMKNSPLSFMAHADSGIQDLTDWEGKTVEINYGASEEVQLRALIEQHELAGIRMVPYQYNFAPFLERRVDLSVAYSMDQPVKLRRRGTELREFRVMDYGVNPYGDVLVAHEDDVRNNPSAIRNFLEATKRALEASIADPGAAVSALIERAPSLDYAEELAVWEATIPFILGDGGNLLDMEPARWQETAALLQQHDLLPSAADLTRAVHYESF